LENPRLVLDAVHQDDANAGEGIVVELTDGRLYEIAPVESLLVERDSFLFEQIESHGSPPRRQQTREGSATVTRSPSGQMTASGERAPPALFELEAITHVDADVGERRLR